jgi:hypothetical protein
MTNVFKQLRDHKTDPSFGAVSVAQQTAARAKLMEAIGHNDAPQEASFSRLQFVRWSFFDAATRPVSAALILIVCLGGGIGTVKAASASLPGETLYGLKLVTEQAQLRLASLEDKAVLHTEFAERRLAEAVAISRMGEDDHGDYLATMSAFRKELALADDHLRQLQQEGYGDTVKVAQTINEKIDALSTVLVASGADAERDLQLSGSVKEAEEATRAVSETVTDVIVETHEQSEDSISSIEISQMFKDDLREIQNRQTYDLGRAVVIGQAFAAHPELRSVASLASVDVEMLEFRITQAGEEIPEAMNLMAAGGFRTAFEMLRSANSALLLLEEELAGVEIEITNALTTPAPAEDDSELGSEASSATEQDHASL